jgi:hypothetical protein
MSLRGLPFEIFMKRGAEIAVASRIGKGRAAPVVRHGGRGHIPVIHKVPKYMNRRRQENRASLERRLANYRVMLVHPEIASAEVMNLEIAAIERELLSLDSEVIAATNTENRPATVTSVEGRFGLRRVGRDKYR